MTPQSSPTPDLSSSLFSTEVSAKQNLEKTEIFMLHLICETILIEAIKN